MKKRLSKEGNGGTILPSPPLLVVLGLLIFFLAGGVLAEDAEGDRGIKVGDAVSSRELKTQGGDTVKIPAEDGLTVLVFWATWSPRSQPALSLWEEYQKSYQEHRITVLAINADHQNMEASDIGKVDAFIEENEIGLPVHVDRNLDLYNEIGVIVVPTVLFFHSDGELIYKYAGFPTSARLDLKEDLERELGILQEPEEAVEVAAEPAYAPKNNSLLFYNLGRRLHEKGMTHKAQERYIMALQKDPEYGDPLRALEGIYFDEGRTPETEQQLRDLLVRSQLEQLVDRIGEGEAMVLGKEKKADPMERMKALMGGSPLEDEEKAE
jgi:thiol-disulfide isomerase/thioredoxin